MTFLDALVATIAMVLFGMNIAIVYRFWPERWLITSMAATTGLLAYVTLSVSLGQPDPWRVWLGFVAVLGDGAALIYLARALRQARAGEGVLIAYRRR